MMDLGAGCGSYIWKFAIMFEWVGDEYFTRLKMMSLLRLIDHLLVAFMATKRRLSIITSLSLKMLMLHSPRQLAPILLYWKFYAPAKEKVMLCPAKSVLIYTWSLWNGLLHVLLNNYGTKYLRVGIEQQWPKSKLATVILKSLSMQWVSVWRIEVSYWD